MSMLTLTKVPARTDLVLNVRHTPAPESFAVTEITAAELAEMSMCECVEEPTIYAAVTPANAVICFECGGLEFPALNAWFTR